MAKKIILFIMAFFVWALLNWPPDRQHMVIGIIVAGFVMYITGDLFVYNAGLFKNPRRLLLLFFYYVPMFFAIMVKASFGVAFCILRPRLNTKSGIVKVKTSLKSDTALTLLANAITLTSGTMTVDIDRENGVLYVHWIDVKAQDVETATKMIVEQFEKVLKKIFE